MKRIGYHSLAIAVLATGLIAGAAFAQNTGCPGVTPSPNGAFIFMNYWHNGLFSIESVTNTYPSLISMSDQTDAGDYGYANKHLWKFSTDGGTTQAAFENCSMYRFCADVTFTGTGNGEGGLEISPWWSDGDGQFMLNYQTGEIAVFAGRLPFYSFTAGYGLHYVKGTTAHLEMVYVPNGLTEASRAYVRYNLTYGAMTYTSGPLYFDQANVGEAALHGLWGALTPHSAGGYFQPYLAGGTSLTNQVDFANICYDNDAPTPVQNSTWGHLKSIYR